MYNDEIHGIGIDPGREKKVKIGLSDLVKNTLHRDPENEPFVLILTGADKITFVKDQDFIARSVVKQDEKNVQLIIDGSGVNLGNQWPESGKCRGVYPVIDHDPNYPLFDLMSISPGKVCKFTRAVLSTTGT